MTKEWLAHILKKGVIKDNSSYKMVDGTFTGGYLPEEIQLHSPPSRRTKSYHYQDQSYKFIEQLAYLFSESLHAKKQLVFFDSDNYEHNTEDPLIRVRGFNEWHFSLETGNLIGFVKQREHSLTISSRFGESFLKYLIADADGFLELKDSGGSQPEQGSDWLLIYLWAIKLKKAYRLGLPKSYVTKRQRLNKVRGTIDSVAYYGAHSDGKYLCNYREHSFNNPAVNLIFHVFKKLGRHPFLESMNTIRHSLAQATNGGTRLQLSLNGDYHFTNPFYNDYNEVIDLSKLILSNGSVDFGENSDTSAFLFDVSMLFEYFMRKLLLRQGFDVLGKFSNSLAIPTTGNSKKHHKLEPDLVIESKGEVIVLDVKYKSFDFTKGVKREDLFQIHTYLSQYSNIFKVKACGFIFPLSSSAYDQHFADQQFGLKIEVIQQSGKEYPFYVFFLKVPAEDKGFYHEMKESSELFARNLEKIFTI